MPMAVTVIVPVPVTRAVSGVRRGGRAGGICVAGTLWAWCPRGTCSVAFLTLADTVFEVSRSFAKREGEKSGGVEMDGVRRGEKE